MDSLKKQSEDQLSGNFTVDDIPIIDVDSDRKTLRSTFETINSVLRHGESHLKLECAERINSSVFVFKNNPKQVMKYEKAVIKTKLSDTMLRLMKFKDFNDLIFKNDDTYHINYGMAVCMWNLSNYYAGIGKVIANAGGISYFTDICRFKPFLDNLDNPRIYEFILAMVAIIHNIARLSPVSQLVRDSKTAEAMVPLIRCKDKKLRISATLAAAVTCDDSEVNMLVDAEGVITSILKFLKTTIQSNNEFYYTVMELMGGIDKLACTDTNKKKILEAGALPLFETILNLDKPEEQALTARVLWTMTFDDDVATAVKSSKTMLARLEMLSKSSDKAVQNNVKGLLYNIKRISKKEKKDTQTQQKGKHVFISYSWNEKEIVLKLKDKLKEKGIPIWIDTEQMRGSTLESMAEAVENAEVVLMCMSESYKRSPNCRLEADYTSSCQKGYIPLIVQERYRPDNWLGVLLGTRLYIDFSGKYLFEPKLNELMKELKAFKILTGEDTVDSSDVATLDSSSSSTNPKKFTIDDVKQWLISNKLENCCQHFGDVNGKGLLQMKRMQHAAPEFYFKTLSRKLKLSLGEILNFSAALEEL